MLISFKEEIWRVIWRVTGKTWAFREMNSQAGVLENTFENERVIPPICFTHLFKFILWNEEQKKAKTCTDDFSSFFPAFFYLWNCSAYTFQRTFFFSSFPPHCLLWLHQPWNGSCRQLDKWIEKLLLPESKKQNPNTHKTFCFCFSKTSTISLWASLKNDAPISCSISAKGVLYPVVPRADVHSWVMARTQPAAMREGGRNGPRKAEQILTSKCTWQINGANQTRHKMLGPAHKDLSCFYTAIFFLDAF